MLKKLLVINCLLAMVITLAAQQQNSGVIRKAVTGQAVASGYYIKAAGLQHTRKYHFTHFNSANGLASNIVRKLIQDHKGYIWLATLDGLQRYDGNKFMTFRNEPGNPSSVPADVIVQVLEDKSHNLWLLGGGKVGIFNTSNFTFKEISFQFKKGISDNDKESKYGPFFLKLNQEGNVLAVTINRTVFTYDNSSRQFIESNFPGMPKEWWLNELYLSTEKKQYYVGTNQGFVIYDYSTGHINYAGNNPDRISMIDDVKKDDFIIRVIGFRGNDFWYSNWPQKGEPILHAYNVVTREHRQYNLSYLFGLGYYEIEGALIQKNGRLWVFGRTFIAEYDDAQQIFRLVRNEYVDEQSIRFDQVFDMQEDKEQNIWIATENGVFLFNPDKELFNNYSLVRPDGSGIIDGPVIDAKQIYENQIWVGCWGTGLYAYDNDFNPITLPKPLQPFKRSFSIWSICKHSKTGVVWMGLQSGSLLIYDPKTGKAECYTDKIFAGSTIRQVVEDKEGNLWFGMQGGHLVKWDPVVAKNDYHKGFKLIRKRDGVRVYKLMVDNKGYLWVGTLVEGVYKYDPRTEQELLHLKSNGTVGHKLWDNQITDIIQHDDTTMLLAGGVINILNTKTNTVSFISTVDGLPSNNVQCLQRDLKGIYWVGMAHGLCRMNIQKKTFGLYDRRDGMAYDNFNPDGIRLLPDGKLVFSTDRSLTVLNPSDIKATPSPDEVLITDIKLANHSLSVDSVLNAGAIVLPYDNAAVNFEFSILDFMKLKKIHYRYMLENLDKSWREASGVGQAIYSYLPPGTYTFMVKAENADGLAGERITRIQVRITPPFWQTWWFYCILALIVAIVLFYIDRERINKMKALQRLRTQIAMNLHEEVNTTLNNITLLSEMAKIKADKDTIRSKEYISQISSKSTSMMDAMDDILWSISPENDSMEKTLVRMKEYAMKIEKQYHVSINFRSDEEVEKLKLDMRQRHELFIIYKHCVQDAVKHLQCFNLDIFIDRDKAKNRLSLKLRGESSMDIEYAARTCPGLSGIRKRVEAIGATLDIIEDRRQVSVILQMQL